MPWWKHPFPWDAGGKTPMRTRRADTLSSQASMRASDRGHIAQYVAPTARRVPRRHATAGEPGGTLAVEARVGTSRGAGDGAGVEAQVAA